MKDRKRQAKTYTRLTHPLVRDSRDEPFRQASWEEALDRAYFTRGLVRLGSSRSKDAKFVEEMLRSEIDRINLRRLFEPRAPGVEPDEVLREVLPRGRLPEQTLREIASATSPERAAEIVSQTPYGDMAEALAAFARTQAERGIPCLWSGMAEAVRISLDLAGVLPEFSLVATVAEATQAAAGNLKLEI